MVTQFRQLDICSASLSKMEAPKTLCNGLLSTIFTQFWGNPLMPRLPKPGGDEGEWGKILNEFLEVEHDEEGKLRFDGSLATKYTKPEPGIPASDLDTTSQTILNDSQVTKSRVDTIEQPGWVTRDRLAADAAATIWARPGFSRPQRISPMTGYESWPIITQTSQERTLVVAYAVGNQHIPPDNTRGVYVRRSTDSGRTWGEAIEVTNDPSLDQSTYGMGLDNNGDILLWIRIAQNSTHPLYRSQDDGLSWSLLVTPALDPKPVLISPPVALGGTNVICAYHANAESGEDVSVGVMRSTDNGESWTQETIGVDGVEHRIFRHPEDGRLLMIGRTQDDGGALWQSQSADNGATWTTLAETNITDGYASPVGFGWFDGLLSLYYYDRNRGVLRSRHATFDAIWGAPTSWPSSIETAYGMVGNYLDSGYPHAVSDGTKTFIVYYAGHSHYPAVYFIEGDWNPKAISAAIGQAPTIDIVTTIHPHNGSPLNTDSTYSVSGTAVFLGAASVPILDELFTQGRVYWRILGVLQAQPGGSVALQFGYRVTNGTSVVTLDSLTTDSTSLTELDSGWVLIPNNLGNVNSGFETKRHQLYLRATTTGGSGSAKVNVMTTLLIGVKR